MDSKSMIFRRGNIFLRSIHLDVLTASTKKGFVIFWLPKYLFGQQNA
jgi:hypothetical protein